MDQLDNINKHLKNHREPVSEKEWNRLKQMMRQKGGQSSNHGIRRIRIPLSVAAGVLLIVGIGVALFLLENNAEQPLASTPLDQERNTLMSSVQMDRLHHRGEMVAIREGEPVSTSISSELGEPYRATLPNGDNWLIHLRLVRDRDHCEATIKSINDKAMQLQLAKIDDECNELRSDGKKAEMKLVEKNGEERIVLVLADGFSSQIEAPISLELQRIY